MLRIKLAVAKALIIFLVAIALAIAFEIVALFNAILTATGSAVRSVRPQFLNTSARGGIEMPKPRPNIFLPIKHYRLFLAMVAVACKNCNTLFDGKFCPQCGQPANTHRVNALYFLHDIPHSILHIDKGFPYTFLQLVKRPAQALEEYLAGKRVRYDRPFSYVLVMSAISVLIVNRLQVYMQHQSAAEAGGHQASFFSHYQAVFIFLMIPLAGGITWLVFRKNKFNFWEHILINTYLAAQLNVLLVLIAIFSVVKYFLTGSGTYSITVFMTGFMLYYAFTFAGLMKKESKGLALGVKLGLMCFLLASVYITAMIFAGIVAA